MAGLRVLGLLVFSVAVPLVYSVGCPDNFYVIGDVCLSLLQTDNQTFADAEAQCKLLNSEATLAIVKDYRTQAQIVSFMLSLDNTKSVYIGLKATPSNPFFSWSDGTPLGFSFTRWGVGQPDGYATMTDTEYCVVLDNSNEKQPGYWYDVPCTEDHGYICSRKLDDSNNDKPLPGLRCTNDFIAFGNSACFNLFNDTFQSYDDAQAACQAMNVGPQFEVNLATVTSGYESALVETFMYSYGVSSAWIGLRSVNNEFTWEMDYPIVYTNWGANEPSNDANEGCVRARTNGDNWDDTTCSDTAAYICRYDKLSMMYPTPDPTLVNLPCPNSDWISQGENCYYFSEQRADWGEANYRCMRMYEGAMLASITSSAANELIYTTAKAKYPGQEFVWIGMSRVQTGNDDWGRFEWIDQEELNYALWTFGQPDGNDPNKPLLESCVAMSITTAGAGAWLDEICQFNALFSVCKLPKQTTYQPQLCGTTLDELKVGDKCYFPSTILGPTQSEQTWNEAENTCRSFNGHITTAKDLDEQVLVRTLSFGFGRSYWIGLRDEGSGLRWSDDTAFNIGQYSEFPGDVLPPNLANEEDCIELRIWQEGEWGRGACGNLLKFVCKREDTSTSPIAPLPGYPTTGECPKDYFKLYNMCYNLRGTDESQRLGWLDARDDCKTASVAGTTLATVSNPGQQALLTAIIKGVGADMWIGLNGIGVSDQYHWTDETRLDFVSWAPGQPDNALPITDPNSASCVAMFNDPEDPGMWHDALCSTKRAYLCQSPLVPSGGDPPPLPGNPCTDSKYSNYFDTCFLMEDINRRSFDAARTDCQSRDGDLLSVDDRYAAALFLYLLYEAGTDASADEAWLGLRRNPTTGTFEWIDKWPLQFTKWGPNEPNNNNGDCVALTRTGYWAVRPCSESKFYFCKSPATPPEVPEPTGGICPPDYVEYPGSDYCYLFDTSSTKILQDAGDLTCATNHDGGRLPSIHSKAEEDFIKAEAQKVFGTSSIWLGVIRNADDFNTWFDQSLMDYVNWETNEPTDDNDADNNCVMLDVNGGWSDVQCSETTNYICKASKFPAPPTAPPIPSVGPPKPGCPDRFYRIGDICLSLLQTDDQTFANAETNCRALNSKATLAVVKDYRTQAQIVSFMMSLDNTQDVYIGLKATPSNPFFSWSDGTPLGFSFTRWGVGQPDGYATMTDTEYCVVLDNSNEKQPGYWYDVPCTEQHRYICSTEVDETITTGFPLPSLRCAGSFIAFGNSACFNLYMGSPQNYDAAQAACQAINIGGRNEVNLATVLNGYESALVETLMYSYDVPHAWIGLKSENNKFTWEMDYPVVYTNWGANEPSNDASEGCVRARTNGDNWDDTTCSDTAAYICRYDKLSMTYPTPDPDLVTLPCPDDNWISQGENCYYFSEQRADWGEANYRCMRMYEGAMLASITSSADNELIYTTAKAKYPGQEFVWIGMSRVQTGNDDWGRFEWIDQEELNYALWTFGQPDGNDPNKPLLESCVAMSITTAGAGAWLDEICQFSALFSVCKLPKQPSYQQQLCGANIEELKVGDKCYFPSTILGPSSSDKTWNEAEDTCREYGGHLVSIHNAEEQTLVRTLSFGFGRSYWLGLRQYENTNFGWSDSTEFKIDQYSEFPGDELPVNLAEEEQCTELLIWQNGEWGRGACGNLLKFVCKREDTSTSPIAPLPGYPTTGECPQDYFKLYNMCYNLRGTDESQRLGWLDARDDCKTASVAGTTLATVSNPGQQALLTAIIKEVGADMWIGLNGIGVSDQYHWTDETRLDFLSWAPGQPDNALPITDPNSASCVAMFNDPEDPGMWHDALCSTTRAYLCQSPLVPSGGDPPPLPGNPCTDNKYANYFDTCFLVEDTTKRSFDAARSDCQSRDGDLLSVDDRYAAALFLYLLYEAGTDASADEAWLGLRRNPDTGVFGWIDEWPLQFTKWGPNEPNNNNGDCVALTRTGYWAVRPCSESKFYFCKSPATPPEVPEPTGGICPPDYVEYPGSDYCYLFDTSSTKILQDAGDLTCATNHDGGRLPSIHSKAEEDFIKTETKKVFGDNAEIWLGITRNADELNTWFDRSLMDYVNWDSNEPTDDSDADNNAVMLDVNGGWSDVDSTLRKNYICKARKFPAPPTNPPQPTSSAVKSVAGWMSVFLTGAVILFARH